jgi:hypothetical protein
MGLDVGFGYFAKGMPPGRRPPDLDLRFASGNGVHTLANLLSSRSRRLPCLGQREVGKGTQSHPPSSAH